MHKVALAEDRCLDERIPTPSSNAPNVILIDNYDSFTWNIYQYLILEGGKVKVIRNDEINLGELIRLEPSHLVISPGPGRPDTDAGISNAAIEFFGGKIPVLGVCLGQQCIITVYGGRVDVTGEILHGKTSQLQHDAKWLYEGLSQGIAVTRYHSLAGIHVSLPECLEVTSWTTAQDPNDLCIIMGVRHREYNVEGVQFHPESIISSEGQKIIRNFIRSKGGDWSNNISKLKLSPIPEKENLLAMNSNQQVNGINAQSKKDSILNTIYDHRRSTVSKQKSKPGYRPADLQSALNLNLFPPLLSFRTRLIQTRFPLSLMAEIKRASPSKGVISSEISAPEQAIRYALCGASVISVLTEPRWFKGSMEDLVMVRKCLEGMPNRPAVLCKDFIFDEYQIMEARLAGADTILLIVKMLDIEKLENLFHYSRLLGMEPLVEVNNAAEMHIAVDIGSKVIGVNNRNLSSFEVDLETTSRLIDIAPNDILICALSGISKAQDIDYYRLSNIRAVLIGESLMRANDLSAYVSELFGSHVSSGRRSELLVKICGTRSVTAARAAVKSGADLIGIILAHNRKRSVSDEIATDIAFAVKSTPKTMKPGVSEHSHLGVEEIGRHDRTRLCLSHPKRALIVGVFQNQPLDYVLAMQRKLDLDVVQLHGNEPVEWASILPVPVIKSFKHSEMGLGSKGYHHTLLDTGDGGTGISHNVDDIKSALAQDPSRNIILAGGLTPDNVKGVLQKLHDYRSQISTIDVSSGIESDGRQNDDKIRDFISVCKSC